MNLRHRVPVATLIVSGALFLVASVPSFGATVFNVTDSITNIGSIASENYLVTPSGLTGNGTISPTISYTLGDAFNGSGQLATGADFGATATGSGGPWNFQDDSYFSTTGATLQTAVISTSLNALTNLQVRLINLAGNSVAPVLGSPAGGTLVDSWQDFTLGSTSYNVTLPKGFSAGDYILQIRGEATGAGSYGGSIAFTPVPLPAALPLLLSALGGLGFAARRRAA
jgi:hypothetical protein